MEENSIQFSDESNERTHMLSVLSRSHSEEVKSLDPDLANEREKDREKHILSSSYNVPSSVGSGSNFIPVMSNSCWMKQSLFGICLLTILLIIFLFTIYPNLFLPSRSENPYHEQPSFFKSNDRNIQNDLKNQQKNSIVNLRETNNTTIGRNLSEISDGYTESFDYKFFTELERNENTSIILSKNKLKQISNKNLFIKRIPFNLEMCENKYNTSFSFLSGNFMDSKHVPPLIYTMPNGGDILVRMLLEFSTGEYKIILSYTFLNILF